MTPHRSDPESVSRSSSPLRKLRRSASALEPRLLPLARAGIAAEEPRLLEREAQPRIETQKRSAEAMADGIGLTILPAARDARFHVERVLLLRDHERREGFLRQDAEEVLLQRLRIHRGLPGAILEELHVGDRGLPFAGGEEVLAFGHERRSLPRPAAQGKEFIEGTRLLRLVRVLGLLEDMQETQHARAEAVPGQHALH